MSQGQKQEQVQAPHLVLLHRSESEIKKALGGGGDAQRFVRTAISEFRSNPKLMQCHPESFMLAIYEAARLGLEIGKQLGQYWLIPRGSEAVPMLGYKGMIALGLRHPDVTGITATPVFEGDYFHWGENMEGQFFEYAPRGERSAEKLTHCYAVCRIKGAKPILDVMTRVEIEACRAKSQMPNGVAWRDSYVEMARKTVIRRLFKYIPMIPVAAEAIAKDEERWGEKTEEVRRPQKYQEALMEAEKVRVIEEGKNAERTES